MPFLFLSPSTQEFNPYITEGNEEYWMNLLADRMEPYLHASGVNTVRNDPAAGAAGAIRLSNQGDYDFHLALHSNASPEALAGQQRGVDFYYYPASTAGLRMANILVDNIKPIYPLPERVQARPTTAIGEVRRTKAPSVLAELGYHGLAWLVQTVILLCGRQIARLLGSKTLDALESLMGLLLTCIAVGLLINGINETYGIQVK